MRERAVGEYGSESDVQRKDAGGMEWGYAGEVMWGFTGEVVMPREAGYSSLSAVYEKSMCKEYVRATQCEPYVSIQAGVIAAYTIMVNMWV